MRFAVLIFTNIKVTVLQDSICSCEGVLREKNQSLREKKDKIDKINSNIRDANAGAEHIKKRAEKMGNIIGSVVFITFVLFCVIGILIMPGQSFGDNAIGILLWCGIGAFIASTAGHICRAIVLKGRRQYEEMLVKKEADLRKHNDDASQLSKEVSDAESKRLELVEFLSKRERELALVTNPAH